MLPARSRTRLRARRLDRRGIIRPPRSRRVAHRLVSIRLASRTGRPRHTSPGWLVCRNSLELRATVSGRIADRAVHRRRPPHTQGRHTHEARVAQRSVRSHQSPIRAARRGGRKTLPPRHRFAPSSASDERRESALRAAPGIASALCGSVCPSSQGVSRRPRAAHNPRLRAGASRERAPRSDGRARR